MQRWPASRAAGSALFLQDALLRLAQEIFKPGLVFDLAAGARLGLNDSAGLGLTDALPCVGLDRFGCREPGWLAFRHSKDEYGIN